MDTTHLSLPCFWLFAVLKISPPHTHKITQTTTKKTIKIVFLVKSWRHCCSKGDQLQQVKTGHHQLMKFFVKFPDKGISPAKFLMISAPLRMNCVDGNFHNMSHLKSFSVLHYKYIELPFSRFLPFVELDEIMKAYKFACLWPLTSLRKYIYHVYYNKQTCLFWKVLFTFLLKNQEFLQLVSP